MTFKIVRLAAEEMKANDMIFRTSVALYLYRTCINNVTASRPMQKRRVKITFCSTKPNELLHVASFKYNQIPTKHFIITRSYFM